MTVYSFVQLSLSLLLGCTTAYLAPLHGMDVSTKEQDVYIVGFHQNHTLEKHWQATSLNLTRTPRFQHLEELNMYITMADGDTLDTIRADQGVQLVEASFMGQAPEIRDFALGGSTQLDIDDEPNRTSGMPSLVDRRRRRQTTWNTDRVQGAPWGLRVVGAADTLPTPVRDGEGDYDFVQDAGLGTWVFVFDSGIRIKKAEFGGRAFDFIFRGNKYVPQGALADEEGRDDKNGHGTFVAGVIGAERFGVAPYAKLVNVKIVLSNGKYVMSGLIRALNDVVSHHKRLSRQPLPGFGYRGSIINMAWLVMPEHSNMFDLAIALAYTNGLFITAAAGNDDEEADLSPCSSQYVFCVGSIDQYYRKSDFSNWGPNVRYQAPGERITSLGLEVGVTDVQSGTAFSTAHLSGAAAIFISWRRISNFRPDPFVWWNALRNRITELHDSRNALVNTGIHNPRKDDLEPFQFAGKDPASRHNKGTYVEETVYTTPKAPPPQTPGPPPPPPPQGTTLTSSGETVTETMPTTYQTTSIAFSTVVYHPTTRGSGAMPTPTDGDCVDNDEL